MIKRGEKRGQVTIFIIIAILIVVLGILIYLYFPKIFSSSSGETINPPAYIQQCMKQKVEDTIQTITVQGGSYVVDDKNGYFYKSAGDDEGNYVRYLCYTNDYFVPCINQEPFLTKHVEEEILDNINDSIENCFASLVKSYKDKGYDVTLINGTPSVSIEPDFVTSYFNKTFTVVRGDEGQTYRNFKVELNSHLYNILEVAKNILVWEITAGDSIQEAYMYDNPSLKVEKHRKDDDVKVYLLTDTDTMEEFRFAVRSFAVPIGF